MTNYGQCYRRNSEGAAMELREEPLNGAAKRSLERSDYPEVIFKARVKG